MKKLLALIVLVLVSAASAQETVSLELTSNQVSTVNALLTMHNEKICGDQLSTLTCTQAQACAASGGSDFSGCTAAQARNAGVRIFPADAAGRDEYITFMLAGPAFQGAKRDLSAWNGEKYCTYIFPTQTQNQRDAVCAARGMSAGCDLCE